MVSRKQCGRNVRAILIGHWQTWRVAPRKSEVGHDWCFLSEPPLGPHCSKDLSAAFLHQALGDGQCYGNGIRYL
jgi:hypothetical protein